MTTRSALCESIHNMPHAIEVDCGATTGSQAISVGVPTCGPVDVHILGNGRRGIQTRGAPSCSKRGDDGGYSARPCRVSSPLKYFPTFLLPPAGVGLLERCIPTSTLMSSKKTSTRAPPSAIVGWTAGNAAPPAAPGIGSHIFRYFHCEACSGDWWRREIGITSLESKRPLRREGEGA